VAGGPAGRTGLLEEAFLPMDGLVVVPNRVGPSGQK
jgi:hypothetical protein